MDQSYEALLADLEQRRAALDAAIAALRRLAESRPGTFSEAHLGSTTRAGMSSA
ncbi:MAG: hypothetical protein HY560_09975 [Gemmatimonadetes bacterium]|nr:hypothetical protein [Gemmatimonadota bacterium]